VFWDEWLAVRELEEVARRYSPLSTPLRSAESTLALVDRAIAQTALNDALGTGRNDYFTKAQDEISQGDLRASQGEFARAIEHYREAWILVGNPKCWDPSDEHE
jgi:hypothetical protein